MPAEVLGAEVSGPEAGKAGTASSALPPQTRPPSSGVDAVSRTSPPLERVRGASGACVGLTTSPKALVTPSASSCIEVLGAGVDAICFRGEA